MPRFKTARGDLTLYSLTCGHIHTTTPDYWMHSTLSKEGMFFTIEKLFNRSALAPFAPDWFEPPFPKTPEFLTITIVCEDLKTARRIHKMGWLAVNDLIIRQDVRWLPDSTIGVNWNTADKDLTDLSNTVFNIAQQAAYDRQRARKIRRRVNDAQRRTKKEPSNA